MNTIYIPINRVRSSRHENTDIILAVLGTAVCFGLSILLEKLWYYSNKFIAAAIFGAVNGSVWEGVKIVCFPLLLWSIIEYFILHVNYYRMMSAALIGIFSAAVFMICMTFICAGVLGYSPTWLNWCIKAAALAVGECVSVKIQRYPGRVEEYFIPAAAGMGILLYALLSFTVNPPHIGLFFDSVRGIYGIA